MDATSIIKTVKTIYPQIYAYTIPGYEPLEGYIKIGYTTRKNVDDRIHEQSNTVHVSCLKLWSGPAKFENRNAWFTDKEFHRYIQTQKGVKRYDTRSEYFFYNGNPEKSLAHFQDFCQDIYTQASDESMPYTLRDEQQAAVEKTLAYANAHPGGKFLWNAKPRFGKTLTSYDLARRLEAKRVLIVTNRPAIANSWYDDFEKFIAWQTDYLFVSTTDSLKNRSVRTREDYMAQLDKPDSERKEGILAFLSLQDLKGSLYFGGNFEKLKWVKDVDWDLLIIDESHEGVDTLRTDVAFRNLKQPKFTLYLSGTPFKAIASNEFSEEEIFNWTYEDEQQAKARWAEQNFAHNPYEALPKLNMLSYQMSRMLVDKVNEGAALDGETMDYAFDLNEFFSTNDKGKFVYEKDVRRWLDTLTRNEKYPFSTKELRDELKHTFWILDRVASAKALLQLLKEHPVFENYEVVLAAGDGRMSEEDSTAKALDRVREAIKTHPKTITLSVGQLTTGVTVPEWSAVLILSNMKSPALYMQAAFRAQNPWKYFTNGTWYEKKNAYVFDFAPERTLIIYDEFANNLNRKTTNGGGTSEDRKENIRTLLNFFPVIAEDNEGKMVELDVNQVLTIPKSIKAQEVVRRGFMSNLLFQNIAGIFSADPSAREILEKISPVEIGKLHPRATDEPIDTQDIKVDEHGNTQIDVGVVLQETDARFGQKIFDTTNTKVANVLTTTSETETTPSSAEKTVQRIINTVAKEYEEPIQQLVKDHNLPKQVATTIANDTLAPMKRDIQLIYKQADIDHKENELAYKQRAAEAQKTKDEAALQAAKEAYEKRKAAIQETTTQNTLTTLKKAQEQIATTAVTQVHQRVQDKKRHVVEDEIRARLRGFARTIPSFLMAYGTPETNLSNFDTTIEDEVFQEVTGITLDQFRVLRDEFQFFSEVVFNESCQEFLRKREALANYFDESTTEDIFDYIPPQRTNQIFTPKKVVKMMVDKLEDENPGLFSNKDITFADLYVKSGLYMAEIVKRLYKGLADQIPDESARLKHILENQVYGFAPSTIIYNIAKNFVYGFSSDAAALNTIHLYNKDTSPLAMSTTSEDFDAKWQKFSGGDIGMKFDIVVGNPPYQENNDFSNRDEAIYPYFYDLAKKVSQKYCIISPARFLLNIGSTNKSWNEMMLADEHIKTLFFSQSSSKVFTNTDIKGGVVVLYRDENKKLGPIGAFTTFDELNTILTKVENKNFSSLNEILFGNSSYKLTERLYEDYPDFANRASKAERKALGSNAFERYPEIFFEEKQHDNQIQIYGRLNNERVYRWVDAVYIQDGGNLNGWKVFVPGANGSGAIGEVLSTPVIGSPVIGSPVIGYTQTFISFGNFNTQSEAEALFKYLKSKFARTMLGIKKVTQNNKTKETWSKVPMQDFTPNSDIDWTKSVSEIDQQLYKKYGLSPEEISFIEEKVKEME